MINKSILLTLAGAALGAITGYLYYHFVGCQTGSCPLTSQPLPSTLYGAFTGGLILNKISGGKKPVT